MRNGFLIVVAVLMSSLAGCASVPVVVENPLFVPAADFENVWQQTIEVMDDYFDVASENRISRRIESYPQVAATLLEPWHRDSVDLHDRAEATLQSERRRAFATVRDVEGGFMVEIEVHKELEDLPFPVRSTSGEALFRNELPLHRETEIVGPLPVARGWIHQGRDWKLESRILDDLGRRFAVR
jgi:hypothetical protein